MMMEVDILKCDSQCPKLIQALVILIKFLRHDKLWMITLKCLQESLSSLGVKALLHLLINSRNSSLEKGDHEVIDLFGISSNKAVLTCQCWAKLKDSWKACHKSSGSRKGHLLYLIALIAESFLFLTQFISFYSLLLLLTIFWILVSKNSYLVFLTTLLKFFQSSKHLEDLYFSNPLWHSSLHYDFKYLVILTTFECLSQILSVLCTISCTNCSRSFLLPIYLDRLDDFSNKAPFFFTIFDNCMLSSLDIFLKNQNINCNWCIIQWHSPFTINHIIVEFL